LTDIELRLRNSDGYQYRIGAAAAYGNSLAIVFPANFLQRAADTPLEGTIDFKLIQYRDSAAGEINMDGSANTIAAGIQCGNRIANQGRWQLHCRSAAALPGEWEVVTLTSGMTVARLTRAAFPIRPTFSPVAARDVGRVRPGTAGAAAVTEPESLPVVIRELVSYERYSLKVQDLRLNDFRIENQVP
jgi:hypothetical protein